MVLLVPVLHCWRCSASPPQKNYVSQGLTHNGFGVEMPFAGNFPSRPICNPKSRLPEQDAEMKAPRKAHFGTELEKMSRNWSEKFPAHPDCLFSSPVSKIKEEELGSEGFHPC